MILVSVTIMFFGAVASLGHFRPPNQEFSPLLGEDLSIVGGHETTIEEHPHQIYVFNPDSIFWCGGTIISEHYVLASVQCLLFVRYPKIRAGSTFRKEGGIVFNVTELIPHPNFSLSTMENDVVLLKTATPMQFGKTIQPIKLAESGRPVADNSIITVTGWGWIKEDKGQNKLNDPYPNHLRVVDIPIVNNVKCHELYKEKINITEKMLCAGDIKSGGKGSCLSDNGGAGVQDGVAVGIMSFSEICARKEYPSVFTRIGTPSVRDFIKKHTGV